MSRVWVPLSGARWSSCIWRPRSAPRCTRRGSPSPKSTSQQYIPPSITVPVQLTGVPSADWAIADLSSASWTPSMSVSPGGTGPCARSQASASIWRYKRAPVRRTEADWA